MSTWNALGIITSFFTFWMKILFIPFFINLKLVKCSSLTNNHATMNAFIKLIYFLILKNFPLFRLIRTLVKGRVVSWSEKKYQHFDEIKPIQKFSCSLFVDPFATTVSKELLCFTPSPFSPVKSIFLFHIQKTDLKSNFRGFKKITRTFWKI